MGNKSFLFAISLLFAFTIIISKTIKAQDYIRLKNTTYLNIEKYKVECGIIKDDWHSAMWELEPVDGTSYIRIKNRWKNTYLNTETGILECTEINKEWHSAMWLIQQVEGTSSFLIKNRWKSTYLNIEDGKVKCSFIDDNQFAIWEKEPISTKISYTGLKKQEKHNSNTFEQWLALAQKNRAELKTQDFAQQAISKIRANEVLNLLNEDKKILYRDKYQYQWDKREFEYGNLKMPFYYKNWGTKPAGGYSLFISLHGGGGTTAAANDQQYENQKHLYDYTMMDMEGVYLAMRAPNNDWDLWHQAHIDKFLNRIIQLAAINEDVNLNKVYILGYSAGGDGLYQIAPRMADRWAAASMMAGHPGDASPLGLRNIGFAIHMGGLDGAYKRNELAKEWKKLLAGLQKNDPQAYKHDVQIHEGKGHWMDGEDALALPWMQKFTRNPIPEKVIWVQDDVFHTEFYWLSVPETSIKKGGIIKAEYDKTDNSINIIENYSDILHLNLNDDMLNLDLPVKVTYKGKTIFEDKVKRKITNLFESMNIKGDHFLTFSAGLIINNNNTVVVK